MAKIDMQLHRRLEAEGFLHIQTHDAAPLLIHNYAPKTQYDRHWTPETLMSRGLITDHEGRIVARPFPKFFNLDEYVGLFGPLPKEPFEVYEKMDGSMGVLYFVDGQPRIATRGSFHSEQADKANEILRRRYSHVRFDPDLTYIFEIIYPENRIVVDYGDQEDLVLLGIFETRSGREQALQDIGLPLVQRYDGLKDLDAIRTMQDSNREGFVIRFASGLRVKVKFEEYVRLHRIISGVSARVIWEYLQEGSEMEALLERVPDEFYRWVKGVQTDLKARYAEIEATARAEFRTFPTRKEAAEYFLAQCTYPAVLFKMLDARPYDPIIWKMIRPEHQTPFRSDDS